MDLAQQKALNALEPFLLLAKTANLPRAAAQVITQATSSPNAFVFAELLHLPNIQALRKSSSEYAPYLRQLEIFAWGTWQEYHEHSDLPKLSEPQALKLRQLSLLSLAITPHLLNYHHLQEVLSLRSSRALEDLVISTIYTGLMSAKLDTLAQRVEVSSVAPLRDLRPGSMPLMKDVLDDWDNRCTRMLIDLDGRMSHVRKKAAKERRREDANERAIAKLLEEKDKDKEGRTDANKVGKMTGKRTVGEEADEMDTAEDAGGAGVASRTRNAKRGGGAVRGKR